MCLATIDSYKQDPGLIKKGYKRGEFIRLLGERVFVTSTLDFHIPVSKWVRDESVEIIYTSGGELYESGFHVFTSRPIFSPAKVFVKEILATGDHWSGEKVIVARQIYIPDRNNIFHRDLLIRLFGKRFLP